jgi:2-amino-4-hydroxy-6-hydroxymethyldihydropteridine diphosphokinase
MTANIRCFIGLGSNLNNPIDQVTRAIDELNTIKQCQLINVSSLYSSEPIGPQDQPNFINAVAELATTLPPHSLLDELQSLEQNHQRIRERHWGPRTLDLDLLLYGNEVINTERLNVPHTFMHERNFVLYPLFEISPELEISKNTLLSSLLVACPMGSLTKI